MLIKLFKLIAKTFFREITVKGLENLSKSDPAIFTPNHPNALLDPLFLYFLSPQYKIRFVAKAPLFKISFLGWIMHRIGVIPVVRKFEAEGKVDYKVFFSSCVDTLAAGESIVIFPEGVSLPQPHMSPLKTGVARLFFLATERDLAIQIVPVGLNYEHGSIFRSSVVVSIAPPLDTDDLTEKYKTFPQAAVRDLTDRISQVLQEHVFQSENARDRELMLLLEQIYSVGKNDNSWRERFERLRQFEIGLKSLSTSHSSEIERLRQMLLKYMKISKTIQISKSMPKGNACYSPKRFLMAISGFPIAGLGWLLTIIPYQLCNLFVKYIKQYDASDAATYKVVYSLFLFPVTFFLETLFVHLWLGWLASLTFAIGIIPISYFTLYYLEWVDEGGWGIPNFSMKLRKNMLDRGAKQLENERSSIIELVSELAGWLEQNPKKMG